MMTPTEAINHLELVAACEPEDFEAVTVIRTAIGFDPGSAKWCAQQPGYLPPSEVGRLREAAQLAADALRDAEDRLVNTLGQVSHGDMMLWKEARELVDSNPDWTTYRIDRLDEGGVFRALIYQFRAVQSVRKALAALFAAGVKDRIGDALRAALASTEPSAEHDHSGCAHGDHTCPVCHASTEPSADHA